MRFRVGEGRYALAAAPVSCARDFFDNLIIAARGALINVVVESDGVSAVAPEEAVAALAGTAGLRVEEGYRIITFETPMTWEVVGFLSLVTGQLARAGVPLGAICAFDRDHLFVHERFLETARKVLTAKICAEA